MAEHRVMSEHLLDVSITGRKDATNRTQWNRKPAQGSSLCQIIHRPPEEAGFNLAVESKTKKAESDSPCAIATKVECPPLTNFVD
jgi:hypothetical protein